MWTVHRTSAQAGMRRIIRRLLKKYDYPPEQAKKALEIVMKQAEKMCGNFDLEDIEKVVEESQDYLLD